MMHLEKEIQKGDPIVSKNICQLKFRESRIKKDMIGLLN